MKNIAQIIKKAKDEGIGLMLAGDDIEVALYKEEVDESIFAIIKENKEEIKTYLKSIHSKEKHLAIPALPASAHYELSSAQHRLWVLSQFEEGSVAYNLPLQMDLKGEYNLDCFTRAVDIVVRRHEILRTIFKVDATGEVRQWILPQEEYDFQVNYQDFRTQEDKEQQAAAYIARDAYQNFDLEKGPLLRASILQLEDQHSIFYCNMHHIISDAWSLNVLTKEVFICYEALKNGEIFHLPALPIHYKDYAVWQKKQAETDHFKKDKAYWLEQLSGELPALDLPFAATRPKVMGYAGQGLNTYLSKKQSKQLNQFSLEQGGSLFMTLLAAWKVLLYRYTWQEDLLIGTPIAGRNHSDLQNQIGFYLNTIVLRNQINRQESFVEFYAKVKDSTLAAYSHNAYPFDELVNELGGNRDRSRNAIFDVMFTLQNTDLAKDATSIQSENADEIKEIATKYSKFDIDVVFEEVGEHLSFTINYNTTIYNKETISNLMRHYRQLLDALLENPDSAIGKVNYLAEEEIHELLYTFNDTQATYPHDQTVLDLFAEQVKSTPDKVAFICGQYEMTYQMLDHSSSQLAHYLSEEYNLNPDDFVGIKLERNEWLPIALLAVLKTSAAYVPIDPAYPAERIEYITKGSSCKICLDKNILENFIAVQATYAKDYLDKRVAPENLAYAIYTSGSTGNPKGVMIEHRNLMNFIFGMDKTIQLDSSNHLLAITSVSFDISVLELLYTLSRGVLISLKSKTTDLSNFNQYLSANQVNLDFSLLFFSSQKTEAQDKYKLLLDTVRFADQNDFNAVWLPERHFHEFGGIFPNPSVLGAALSTMTEQINIRSGSVVLPLHDTIRVAEEWAVVDNLSKGRVSLSIASGWHSNDFVLKPDNYRKRQAFMFDQIDELRRLWKGEEIIRFNGVGQEIKLKTFPRPIQKELPIWVTSGGNEETFKSAGRIGANILTHLLGQDIDLLQKNIQVYKETLEANGYAADKAKVSLMLHTYVGEDLASVRESVKEPFKAYLRSSVGLIKNMLKEFTDDTDNISENDLENLLELAFERYWQTSALFGTQESCSDLLNKLKIIGVTEVACLIDFGLDNKEVMQGLDYLNGLRQAFHIPKAKLESKTKEIDSLQITPSYLKTLIEDEGSQEFVGSLKNLIVGGERFPQELADRLESQTQAAITNMYGPTETTIWSATQKINGEEKVTVGKPIQNTTIYILDEQMQLCPKGVIGTLYIGGDGVSRGYYKQADLTAERFLPNPFQTTAESRIYNTGDLALWLPDGKIELLGRSDNQVKINGYRIELEEIESTLLKHPMVSNAAVTVYSDNAGNKSLRAHVVSHSTVYTNELRDFLNEKLPHYMVPANFMELDALPLTANGKINRNALMKIEGAGMDSGVAFIEASNDVEEKLVEIWSELLGKKKEEIGVKSNFFDLGGNSVLAIKLLSRINAVFQVQIPLVNIYSESNIQKLANYLNGKQVAVQVEEEHLDVLADTMENAFNKLINNEH